jgi:glycosyltransferase involved in cell wall biosynthesis
MFGGVTNVTFNIAKKLVERGHKVTVFTTDVGNDKKHRLKVKQSAELEGIKIFYFRNISNQIAFTYKIFSPLGMILSIYKSINDFDVIHIHDYRNLLSVITYFFAKKYSVPYIIQAHGSLPIMGDKKVLKKIFDYTWGVKILRGSSAAIALTETERDEYCQKGVNENKIVIVPNGININEFEHLPEKGCFRNKYGIKCDEKIILYVGRIASSKGIDLLIESFYGIHSDYGAIKLVIVGPDDGSSAILTNLIKQLDITKSVILTGYVTQEEKIESFVDADIFVTPKFSGFPITFLESCICGCPIITTTNGDNLDWIHKQVGFVVNYDKEELSGAIKKVLSDKNIREKFSDNAKKLIRNKFDWEIIVDEIESIYRSKLTVF